MNTQSNNIGLLSDRIMIEVKGLDAATFLQSIITTNIDEVTSGTMRAGALLSPQGKILFDFLIGKDEDRFFIDTPSTIAETLAKRLSLYKLRAAVEITIHQAMPVLLSYHNTPSYTGKTQFCFIDGRFPDNEVILRSYLPSTPPNMIQLTRRNWDRMRIANALAESGTDFVLGDVFPHDINLDQIGGLSFAKGCYIGQEVVSRMQHRGTARRRLLLVTSEKILPASGTVIEAAGKPLGVMGSHIDTLKGCEGLSIVRLDRVKSALDKGLPILTNSIEIRLEIPKRAQFSYPSTPAEDA